MKVIDSIWISTVLGNFGLVVGENDTGERKLYGGIASGDNQEDDEIMIMALGNKLNLATIEGLIARVREKTG